MKQVTLGQSDVRLSCVIMGLWQAGKEYWTGIDDVEIQHAIGAALDAGITTFDTAEEYGNGFSEQALGRALKGRRDRAVILSKVFSNHLKHDEVLAACDRSLRNLQTDYLDLYQIHWPSGSWESEPVPIAETMGALNELKRQGKIRAIGVSNFSMAQLEEARAHGQIDSLQSPYSLFWRYLDRELVPLCARERITVLAYSPLAQGVLTGKFRPGHRFDEGDNRRLNKLVAEDTFSDVDRAVQGLKAIAETKGITPSQLALAWILHRGVVPIAGARKASQVADNAGAAAISFSPAEVSAIEAIASPISDRFRHDPIPWFWAP